ncbi:MAG: SDR family NAD(P)-dependent oxidoreductase [Candidatus Levyibacteriota bacterium]
MRLQHKTAIITGGGTGIGKAIAIAFAKEGASVVVCARRTKPLEDTIVEIEENGGKAFACSVDVLSSTDIAQVVQKTLTRFGAIDILVNNAGVAAGGNCITTTGESWDNVLGIDAKGVFLMAKAVLPHMVSQNEGNIINIASIAGLVGFANSVAYCAAKGAVANMTRQMALDFAKNNIHVNAIAPGFIETHMIEAYVANPEFKKDLLVKTPLGRIGKPDDIAYAALYLASNESDFMTGQILTVDGGWTIQ